MQHVVFCTHGAHRDDEDDEALGRSVHGCTLIGALADHMQSVMLSGQGEAYVLHAWCVMPNHVHALLDARKSVSDIVKAWKALAARAPDAPGPLWQKNYFDRFMRSEEQVYFTRSYIEANPVKAGLVDRADQWRWSSAWKG